VKEPGEKRRRVDAILKTLGEEVAPSTSVSHLHFLFPSSDLVSLFNLDDLEVQASWVFNHHLSQPRVSLLVTVVHLSPTIFPSTAQVFYSPPLTNLEILSLPPPRGLSPPSAMRSHFVKQHQIGFHLEFHHFYHPWVH
jgi:hypothetical protein